MFACSTPAAFATHRSVLWMPNGVRLQEVIERWLALLRTNQRRYTDGDRHGDGDRREAPPRPLSFKQVRSVLFCDGRRGRVPCFLKQVGG